MSIELKDIDKIENLSRLNVPGEQKEVLLGEINNILGWIEQLNEVDTDGVKPMTSVIESDTPLRMDEVTEGNIVDKVLANAPDAQQNFYVVNKVVE